MNLKSITNKIIESGRLILTQPTMLFIQKDDIAFIEKEHYVTADEEGRPDLICLDYYNTTEHIDYLLKFNGISDPFSLKEGDIIKIPVHGPFFKKMERPSTAIDNIVRQEFLDKKRLTKKDQKRIDFLKKKSGLKEILPPNVLKTGFKTFKFTETEDGQKATELGMGAMLPDVKKSNIKTAREVKGLGSVFDESWKKVDSSILDKNMQDLTLKDVDSLKKAGIQLEDFENVKAQKQEADKSNNTSAYPEVKEIYDDKGNLVGKESIKRNTTFDSGKKTTTITKTTINIKDGSIQTVATNMSSKAGDDSNNFESVKKAGGKDLEDVSANPKEKSKKKNSNSKTSEKGLENKVSKKKADKEKKILKNKENKSKNIRRDRNGRTGQ